MERWQKGPTHAPVASMVGLGVDRSCEGRFFVTMGWSSRSVADLNAVLVVDGGHCAPMNPVAHAQQRVNVRVHPGARAALPRPGKHVTQPILRPVCQAARSTVIDCAQAACDACLRAGERGGAPAC